MITDDADLVGAFLVSHPMYLMSAFGMNGRLETVMHPGKQ